MTFDPHDMASRSTSDHFDSMFHGQFGTRNCPVNEASMNLMNLLGGLIFIGSIRDPIQKFGDFPFFGSFCKPDP